MARLAVAYLNGWQLARLAVAYLTGSGQVRTLAIWSAWLAVARLAVAGLRTYWSGSGYVLNRPARRPTLRNSRYVRMQKLARLTIRENCQMGTLAQSPVAVS